MVTYRTGVDTNHDFGPRYDWPEIYQGYLLGSYHIGYLVGSFFAGFLQQTYNTVQLLTFTTFIQGVLLMLVPLLCKLHWSFVLVNRLICGFLGSFLFPTCHTLISRWSPLDERGLLASSILGGSTATLFLWAILGHSIPRLGWIQSWYVLGVVVCSWSIYFCWICYPSPNVHPDIREAERDYIASQIQELRPYKPREIIFPPFKSITSNIHFYSWCILHFGNEWGLYFLLNQAPKFLVEGLGFDIKYSGALAGLPNLFRCFFGVVFGIIGDHIVRYQVIPTTETRKLFVVFSHLLPGFIVWYMTFAERGQVLFPLGLLCMALSLNGASVITNYQVQYDLAPNYAGSLSGFANGIAGTMSALAAQQFQSRIAEHSNTTQAWRKNFMLGAFFYWFSGLQFMLIGSAKVQEFNSYEVGLKRIRRRELRRNESKTMKGIKSPPPGAAPGASTPGAP